MKKNVNIYYALFQSTYWMGYAVYGGFTSAYLLGIGLDNGTIGLILAISGALAALISPFVGQIIDRNEKISNKRVLLVLVGAIVLLGFFLNSFGNNNALAGGLIYGIGFFILLVSQPFTNALAMASINSGYILDFGPTRAMGAVGYAVMAAIFGQVSAGLGTGLVPLFSAILFLINIIMLVIYPAKETAVSQKKEEGNTSALEFLKKYKMFSIMLVGMTFLYFSHMLINTFAFQIVQSKGGDSNHMGIAIAIAAVSETITMIFFSFYKKKLKLYNVIRLSGIFFVLKTLLSLLVPNVAGFYAVQVLQMFAWGFLATGSVFYVNELVEEKDKAQGQAFAGMTLTFGNVFAAFFGGFILDWNGVDTMLIFGTVMAIIGAVILWLSTKPVGEEIQAIKN